MFSIIIPQNINIKIGSNWISIKSPKGACVKNKPLDLILYKKNNKLYCLQEMDTNRTLFFNCLSNIIKNFSVGCFIKLKLLGIGFKVTKNQNILEFKLGFSHKVYYKIPKNIDIFISDTKDPIILISGLEFQQVMKTACEIRDLKRPDVYKGKGIRFFNEKIFLKEGKKTNL